MSEIVKVKQERARHVAAMREIQNRSEAEKRSALTAEEQAQWDRAFAEADKLGAKVKELEAADERRARVAALDEELRSVSGPGLDEVPAALRDGSPERRAAFRKFLMHGNDSLDATERRALQGDLPASGGYLEAPPEQLASLLKFLDDALVVVGLASVFQLTTRTGGFAPQLTADPADAEWTSELGIGGTADSTMAIGKRELRAKPLAKSIKVSRDLLSSVPSVEAVVMQRLAYKHAVALEKALLTGTGAGQPLGVFTASDDGIPTSRDVSTDNTTTAVTVDGILNAIYSVAPQYRRSPKFGLLGHRDLYKMLAKLKDGEGQYLWEPSVKLGQPDMFKGVPCYESEFAPSTFTTGLYVGLVGDFSYYWLVRWMGAEIQRLNELYAGSNQIGFIGRLHADGAPVLSQAFARVKLA